MGVPDSPNVNVFLTPQRLKKGEAFRSDFQGEQGFQIRTLHRKSISAGSEAAQKRESHSRMAVRGPGSEAQVTDLESPQSGFRSWISLQKNDISGRLASVVRATFPIAISIGVGFSAGTILVREASGFQLARTLDEQVRVQQDEVGGSHTPPLQRSATNTAVIDESETLRDETLLLASLKVHRTGNDSFRKPALRLNARPKARTAPKAIPSASEIPLATHTAQNSTDNRPKHAADYLRDQGLAFREPIDASVQQNVRGQESVFAPPSANSVQPLSRLATALDTSKQPEEGDGTRFARATSVTSSEVANLRQSVAPVPGEKALGLASSLRPKKRPLAPKAGTGVALVTQVSVPLIEIDAKDASTGAGLMPLDDEARQALISGPSGSTEPFGGNADPQATVESHDSPTVNNQVWDAAKVEHVGSTLAISGECDPACTLYLAMPSEQVCITPGASFSFHLPRGADLVSNTRAAEFMLSKYPEWVREWIAKNGGLSGGTLEMSGEYASRFMRTCDATSTIVQVPLHPEAEGSLTMGSTDETDSNVMRALFGRALRGSTVARDQPSTVRPSSSLEEHFASNR